MHAADATSPSAAGAVASIIPLANNGTNPLIPVTISSTCQSFLQNLNGDTTLSNCTAPLISTLALFAPSQVAGSTFTVTKAEVTASLASLCAQTECSDALIRSRLSAFNGNCTNELQTNNPTVLGIYDVLYTLRPFTAAVCSKDVLGGYCLSDIAYGFVPSALSNDSSSISTPAVAPVTEPLSSSGSANATVVNGTAINSTTSGFSVTRLYVQASSSDFDITSYAGMAMDPRALYTSFTSLVPRILRRAPANETLTNSTSTSTNHTLANSTHTVTLPSTGLLPNASTWRESSLPFLFLSPNMSSTLLCTSCTKSVLSAYIAWESRMPYALGLSNSPLLGGQSNLWAGVGQICGKGFQGSVATQAGQSVLTAAAGRVGTGTVGAGIALAAGLLLAGW